jgi:hypothetical protein
MPTSLPIVTNRSTGTDSDNWKSVLGKPVVTVSPVGVGTTGIVNNGADFGPDTPSTSTCGIQEAINSLSSTTGTVYLLPGIFNVTATVQMGSQIRLEGSGSASSIVKGTVDPVLEVNALNFAVIDNLTVDGGSSTTNCCLLFAGASNGWCRVTNFVAQNAGNAIIAGSFNYGYMDTIKAWNIPGFGLHIYNSENSIFVNLNFEQLTPTAGVGTGLLIDDNTMMCQGLAFFGCTIVGNDINFSITNGLELVFIGCIFDQGASTAGPCQISGGDQIDFTDCYFGTNTSTATGSQEFLAQANHALISRLRFNHCDFAGVFGNGVIVAAGTYTCTYVEFTNCTIVGAASGAYDLLLNNVSHVYVYGCDLEYSTGTGNVAMLGTCTDVLFQGGYIVGGLAKFYVANPAGSIRCDQVYNINQGGFGVTFAVPTSGTPKTNAFPFPVRLAILTATVIGTATYTIKDANGVTGAVTPIALGAIITLDPGAVITLTYTTLTWSAYGV